MHNVGSQDSPRMNVLHGYHELVEQVSHPVVTIGNFDGVHRGHQRILAMTLEKARQRHGTAVAYTFRPHPQLALRPGTPLQLLCSYDEKIELLGAQGAELVIEEPFSREFSTFTAEKFFGEVLMRRLHAEAIVVGYDFAFGSDRQGGLETLDRLCKSAHVELTVVEAERIGEEVVSSTRIRQHLLAGEIRAANALLGREFSYRGTVFRGDGRGRQIGFPTANLRPDGQLVLPFGVYATWSEIGGAGSSATRRIPSVTNIGVRPTFIKVGEAEPPVVIETHLLDESLDLYGSTLSVKFVGRLRAERRFKGAAELQLQISQDVSEARRVLVCGS